MSGVEQPPGYWMHETGGVLRPVVLAYLTGEPMEYEQVLVMRGYLQQWIASPFWRGPEIQRLRATVDDINDRKDIARWIALAEEVGVDPL